MVRFLCIVLLASCVHTDKATSNFKSLLNSSANSETTKIRFEGAYTREGYFLLAPIYFFKNGLIFYENGTVLDSSVNDKWIRKYLPEKMVWGTYNINGDTIKACIYFAYYGGPANYKLTYFQGVIKNTNTILQWHMVEPYPKLNKELRKSYSFLFTDKSDLHFKPLSIKSFMDSVSEKAWILKYRDKK